MCDTILAPPKTTAHGGMLFGKNSDRQRNEAQIVELVARSEHAEGDEVRCTYLSIPQSRRSHAMLLCRPYWLWGAEMGVNEFGVAIGNEALHAHSAPPQTPALLGMDLLRLGLERSETALEAAEVITTLLERYGQGGNGGHLKPSYYNNGFMIADKNEAFVLETVNREWLVERVGGVRTMSNRYSIGCDVERMSAGLTALVRVNGWSTADRPDFANVIANPEREHLGNAGARRARSTELLERKVGRVGVADMQRVLRDHGHDEAPSWRQACTVQRTICMHAGAADRLGQTTNSLVAELNAKNIVSWVTGTAAPCISVFKPVLFDVPLPLGPAPNGRFDRSALWWRHESFHRAAVEGDFGRLIEDIRPEQEALEAKFRAEIAAVLTGGSAADRAQVVAECWSKAQTLESQWSTRITSALADRPAAYDLAWREFNALAGVPESA